MAPWVADFANTAPKKILNDGLCDIIVNNFKIFFRVWINQLVQGLI